MRLYIKIIASLTLLLYLAACSTPVTKMRFMPKVSDFEIKRQNPKSIMLAPVIRAGVYKDYADLLSSHMTSILHSAGFYVFPPLLSRSLQKRFHYTNGDFQQRFPVSGQFTEPLSPSEVENFAHNMGADAVLYTEIVPSYTGNGYLNIRFILVSARDGRMLWNSHSLSKIKGDGIGNIGGGNSPGIIIVAAVILALYLTAKGVELISDSITGYNGYLYRLRDRVNYRVNKGALGALHNSRKSKKKESNEDYFAD